MQIANDGERTVNHSRKSGGNMNVILRASSVCDNNHCTGERSRQGVKSRVIDDTSAYARAATTAPISSTPLVRVTPAPIEVIPGRPLPMANRPLHVPLLNDTLT